MVNLIDIIGQWTGKDIIQSAEVWPYLPVRK